MVGLLQNSRVPWNMGRPSTVVSMKTALALPSPTKEQFTSLGMVSILSLDLVVACSPTTALLLGPYSGIRVQNPRDGRDLSLQRSGSRF